MMRYYVAVRDDDATVAHYVSADPHGPENIRAVWNGVGVRPAVPPALARHSVPLWSCRRVADGATFWTVRAFDRPHAGLVLAGRDEAVLCDALDQHRADNEEISRVVGVTVATPYIPTHHAVLWLNHEEYCTILSALLTASYRDDGSDPEYSAALDTLRERVALLGTYT